MNAAPPSERVLEKRLAAKLRELLTAVPWLHGWHVLQNPAAYRRAFDILASVPLPNGNSAELWVDCRNLPRPSLFPYVTAMNEFDARGKRTTRVRVLAAPFITARMAELCLKHGWSWFDLAGNCRINVPNGFYIERTGNDPVHRPPRPAANLGTAESARVLRALLVPKNAGTRWTQRSLQQGCEPGVSIGLVNKVVHYLREQAFLMEDEHGGFHLHDPVGLLAAWKAAYRFDSHQRSGYFTLKQGRALREALGEFGLIAGGHVVYAAFSAAEIQAPHVRQAKVWLFVGAEWEEKFAQALDAKPVDSGENLVVLLPVDDGVFFGREGKGGGLACTSPVQTYVDLSRCGGRGEEAAEALLEHNLKPAWRARGIKP